MVTGIGGSTFAAELDAVGNVRALVPPIAVDEHVRRIESAQRRMAETGIEALWLDGTTNLAYFTGVVHGQSERMIGAIVPQRGAIRYLAPGFEVERLKSMLKMPADVAGWEEDDSPFERCCAMLSEMQIPSGTIAIDDHARMHVVEGLRKAGVRYTFSGSTAVASKLREHKSEHEIALLRHAMQTTLDIQAAAARCLHDGVTTTQVREFLETAHRRAGFDGGLRFGIVLFGAETAYPHGVSYPQTLKSGDMVLIDVGAFMHGYASDITRSYVFGEPTDRQRFLWSVDQQSQLAGFRAAKPGAPASAIDDAARDTIVAAGFGPGYATPGLPHRTGHGVGMDGHEAPYFVKGDNTPLTPGICGSIEPTLVIYGECGIRLEDHIVMTRAGAEWLTQPSPSIDDPFGVG